MKKNKIRRCYRIDPFIYEELKKMVARIGTTETNFVQIAIFEKISRIQAQKYQDD